MCSSALKVALQTRRWRISLQIYADTIHPASGHMAVCTAVGSALWSLHGPTDFPQTQKSVETEAGQLFQTSPVASRSGAATLLRAAHASLA